MSYSQRAIKSSHLKDGRGLIYLTYGVVTSASSADHDVKVGREWITKDHMHEKLELLSRKTGRDYTVSVLEPEDIDDIISRKGQQERKIDAVAIVGLSIEQMLGLSGCQSADSLTTRKSLLSVLHQPRIILRDLKSIGFPDEINESDLYLHTEYYND